MSRAFAPILPRPFEDDNGTQSLPAIPSHVESPLYAYESMPSPAMQTKSEPDSTPIPFEQPLSMEKENIPQPGLTEEPCAIEPEYIRPYGNGDATLPLWPSEIRNLGDTNWLLPAYSDHSSSLASVLRTEIQSHNITREMLHSTEQRRLEGAQRCKQLQADLQSWVTAYNTLTTTLARYAEEFSRISTENVTLKTRMQCAPVRTSHIIVWIK